MDKINMKLTIGELHKAFYYLNRDLFGGKLSEPTIVVQSRGNRKLTLGWCSVNKIWKSESLQIEKYEINIVAEAINRGLLPVMSTLLHEMVHLYNLENNIKDTSRNYTYHNKNFKAMAEKFGLEVEHEDKVGWAVTRLTQSTVKLIYSYGINEDAFAMGRLEASEDEEKLKKKGNVRKYYCPNCGISVRATKEVFIGCMDCKVVMVCDDPVDEQDDEEEELEDNNEKIETETPVEYCCKECGCISEIYSYEEVKCKECDSEDVLKGFSQEPMIGEVNMMLSDGNKKIPVKQKSFI